MSLTESLSPLMAGVKDNPRLRLGLWLVVGIFWLYGLLLLRDEARLATSEHQTLAKKVENAGAVKSKRMESAR